MVSHQRFNFKFKKNPFEIFYDSNQSKKRANRRWTMNGLASISPLTMKLVRIIQFSMCIKHLHKDEMDMHVPFVEQLISGFR